MQTLNLYSQESLKFSNHRLNLSLVIDHVISSDRLHCSRLQRSLHHHLKFHRLSKQSNRGHFRDTYQIDKLGFLDIATLAVNSVFRLSTI